MIFSAPWKTGKQIATVKVTKAVHGPQPNERHCLANSLRGQTKRGSHSMIEAMPAHFIH
jgi:hypothetical protein